jgi:hypothetical protein
MTTEDRPANVAALAAQLDTSTEMLLDRLSGLTDEEYLWDPVPGSWSLRPREQVKTAKASGRGSFVAEYEEETPDPAPMRTIAWLIWHLSAGCIMRADYTIGGRSLEYDDIERPATADAGLAQLRHGLARWRAVFDEVAPDEYAQVGRSTFPYGLDPQLPLADILWWQNREVIHHGAEMAMLRDLYAWRDRS